MKTTLEDARGKMKTIRNILVDGYDIEIDQELIDHLPEKRAIMKAELPQAVRVLKQLKKMERESKKAAKEIEKRYGGSYLLSETSEGLNEAVCTQALCAYGSPRFLAMQEKAAIAYKAGKGRRRRVYEHLVFGE